MSDMAQTIVPKSDQLNSDDLITGPITIKVTGVSIRGGQEQPVSIHYEGDNGKPYKSCKSMNRVIVTAWGADSKAYTGRSMTLYRDPSVKWGGMDVGGIRISHMSHIDKALTMALTMTKQSRKPFTVKPLATDSAPASTISPDSKPAVLAAGAGAEPLSEDELLRRKAREFAETGTDKYAAWFEKLTPKQQKVIGAKLHDELWAIAERATI